MTNHLSVILVGPCAWRPPLETHLQSVGGILIHYDGRTEVPIRQLALAHPAMILVDGAGEGWLRWVVAPKTRPATRRIPVVVITPDEDGRQAALKAGADFALSPEEIGSHFPHLLRDHGRVMRADIAEKLHAQCHDPLPPRALQAVGLFNQGAYYRQHDLFEELWVEETGPVRDLYRAILQVGVGYYQITRGNRRGALKMLLRSIQWLAVLPDTCRGVDVAHLRESAGRVREALERLPEGDDLASFDMTLLEPIQLVKDSFGE